MASDDRFPLPTKKYRWYVLFFHALTLGSLAGALAWILWNARHDLGWPQIVASVLLLAQMGIYIGLMIFGRQWPLPRNRLLLYFAVNLAIWLIEYWLLPEVYWIVFAYLGQMFGLLPARFAIFATLFVSAILFASSAGWGAAAGWAAKELQGLEQIKGIGGHPNVVTLFDIWWINGYLVTRWELGEMSLEARLLQCFGQSIPAIPRDELLVYMRDAADGIDFLNREQGIYHRDIKPENVLLFHRRVKLADLGLAKFAGASTASHTGSGTLGYIPPEGYEDHLLSPTIDVYSLAATYLRLRTGNHPFGDPRNPVQLIQRQVAGRPVLKGLDRDEKKVVAPALAARPKRSSWRSIHTRA